MSRVPLTESNDEWQLVDSDQDIRGWTVQDASGSPLGQVREMIVDTDSEYVDAVVLDSGQEIPASQFELGDGVVHATAAAVPSEQSLGAADAPIATGAVGRRLTGDRMRIQRHAEELRADKTAAQVGEVTVTKDVVEEQRTLEVPLTREEVQVTSRPVDRPAGAGDFASTEESIRIPIREEQVSVTKTPRVVEEVEIAKVARQETQQVSDTVRREEIRIDEQGEVDIDRAG